MTEWIGSLKINITVLILCFEYLNNTKRQQIFMTQSTFPNFTLTKMSISHFSLVVWWCWYCLCSMTVPFCLSMSVVSVAADLQRHNCAEESRASSRHIWSWSTPSSDCGPAWSCLRVRRRRRTDRGAHYTWKEGVQNNKTHGHFINTKMRLWQNQHKAERNTHRRKSDRQSIFQRCIGWYK